MERSRLVAWLDALGMALLAAGALGLRSDLSYRTAFVDEATNLYGGWQMLQGREVHAISYHMGWPPLSFGPLGLAGWLGGLEAARGLNALLGTLTVLVVMLMARRVYGRAAGYIAGALYALYAPAIFVSTFATYDALSVLLASVGLYLWIVALLGRRRGLYALGSLAMAVAVLTKYAAVMVVAAGALLVALAAIGGAATGASRAGRGFWGFSREALGLLALIALPLLVVPAYGLHYREALMANWQGQVVIKQVNEPRVGLRIVAETAGYVGLLAILGGPALLARGRRLLGLGLALIGVSMLPYHLLNRDTSTLFKHTCYLALGLAPLAGGGVVAVTRWLTGGRTWAIAGAGLLVVSAWGVRQQRQLPALRSYWPDTTEAMAYLRRAVPEGSTVLMEAGMVGQYYLIEKGEPGHIPREVYHTWYYADELGAGPAAFLRGLEGQRFDWVVLDYTVTKELDRELLTAMIGRYEHVAAFAARMDGGRIDVFRALRYRPPATSGR